MKNKCITITGARGFLGSHLVSLLEERGYKNIFTFSKKDYDLRKISAIRRLLKDSKPQVIIHLAGDVGGIGYNQKYPATLFYDNLIMGIQFMEEARKKEVEKFVSLATICSYPKFTPVPFKEEDLWRGYPEETNAPYGLAKKMLLVQAQSYRKQYDFNAITLFPTNLYGPGDHFQENKSHVIPAIIKKCFDAIRKNKKEITLWGTGKPTREFLYVEDAAKGIILATEKYNKPKSVNLGSGFEISIKDLAHLIAKLVGFKGKIIWDTSKPDGQPRRSVDTMRAEKEFGFEAKTDFTKGLKNAIRWYEGSQR